MQFDQEVDFLVVGSGAGGMAGAVCAKALGMSALVIEKTAYYGGTSALSGGVIWVPNNHHMAKVPVADCQQDAIDYLSPLVKDDVSPEKLMAYIDGAPEMLEFIEQHSLLKYDPAPVYPDYYAENKGGKKGARSLDPKPYSMRKMGYPLASQMRGPDIENPNGFCMTADEAHQVFSFTWKSPLVIFKCLLTHYLDLPYRLKKRLSNRLTLGRALVGRLRHSMQLAGIDLWLNTDAKEILQENGKVVGLVVEREGKKITIGCKHLLLASGGFTKNQDLREQYLPKPTSANWSAASRYDAGDGIVLGQSVGGKIAGMGQVWWTPTMVMPGGEVEAFIVGKSMPSCMVVDKRGMRFCNEAEPYEDFVKHQYAANTQEGLSIPAYFIFDARYRREYPIGSVIAPSKYKPDSQYEHFFASGWIKKASTLEELAELCQIDAKGLLKTADDLAHYAKTGVDEAFGKGSVLNDRYYSDHRIKPNPCLAPLDNAPYYAVQIWPGDLGTKGGLLTNQHGEVLDENHQVIKGLYATGNVTASVMGNSYPGAGSTLGPALTFAYLAAKHAAQSGQ